MDAIEAILTRRSVPKVSDTAPEASEIQRLLDVAIRAPNHHLTEPWRFIVMKGESLDQLGEAMAERVREQYAGDPDLEKRIEAERSRPRRAPVIVVVVYSPSDNPKAIEREDRYAVGALMQNILLAAHASGLGAYLRTGPAAEYEGVHRFLGLEPREEIAGFIYLGYPAEDPGTSQTPRIPAENKTEWRGWDVS
jgi:nitroreductase